jgi:hypothetical protein
MLGAAGRAQSTLSTANTRTVTQQPRLIQRLSRRTHCTLAHLTRAVRTQWEQQLDGSAATHRRGFLPRANRPQLQPE